MAERQTTSSATAATVSDNLACPRVADLIQFALGRCSSDEQQHIKRHLDGSPGCSCGRWVASAGRTINPAAENLPPGLPAAPAIPDDRTPIPPSTRWRKQVFRDLEARLKLLDDA